MAVEPLFKHTDCSPVLLWLIGFNVKVFFLLECVSIRICLPLLWIHYGVSCSLEQGRRGFDLILALHKHSFLRLDFKWHHPQHLATNRIRSSRVLNLVVLPQASPGRRRRGEKMRGRGGGKGYGRQTNEF